MAKRRKKNSGGQVLTALSLIVRPQVVGIGLILLALFTLLSLLTNSRGSITGLWVDALVSWTGVGVWGVPLITGFVGLWMVIRVIEKMPDLPWQRPLGLALLFFAIVTGATLWIPRGLRVEQVAAGEGGGAIGLFLAQSLEAGLSLWGAWAVVTMLTIIGLILFTDRLLIDLALDAYDALRRLLAPKEMAYADPLNPPLPFPEEKGQPWWQRLWGRPSTDPQENGEDVRINGGRHVQPSPAPSSGSGAPPAPAGNAVAPPPRQPVTQPSEDPALIPRRVESGHNWQLPRLADMLDDWDRQVDSYDRIRERGRLIEQTLELFGVPARFKEVNIGPTVTQYLIEPGYLERTVRGEVKRTKVKVSKIAALSNDLALALAASAVRIEAPVPGTNYVGIEVPNQESNVVGLKELMETPEFERSALKGRLPFALGEDVKGKPVVADLARMPHLLIAGATGSGKSICINSIISGLLLTHTPETLRLLMVDPKMVELTVYNGVPHLLSPVVTDVERASGLLFWGVKEMERRYQLLNKANTRDIIRYNEHLTKQGQPTLPYIVVIIDEMADLMMAAPEEVEKHICRLAQMARAVGIHLIVATQRPSVDVITGLIKANFPARIAFAVTSQTDSRVILDVPGADRLLGRGDMLFMAPDSSKLERLQGTFLSDDEINRLVRYWKGIRSLENYTPPPLPDVTQAVGSETLPPSPAEASPQAWTDPDLVRQTHQGDGQLVQPLFDQIEVMKMVESRDDLFDEAVRVVREVGRGSTTLLQRRLRVGYNRASRLVEQLEEAGVLGPDQGGSQGRVVYTGSGAAPKTPPPPSPMDDDPPLPRPRRTSQPGAGDDPPPRIWM